MALNEAQEQLILSVENDPGMGPDFLEDWATKEAGFDSSITDEERIQAKLELAQAYHDTSIDEAEEKKAVVEDTSAATTGLEMENLQGSINESKEKFRYKSPYSVYDILLQNKSPFLEQIQEQLTAAKSKETVEVFCDKIEGVWQEYIQGSLKVTLPEENLKSMATGLSFYFMDRLKNSNVDAGEIADNANKMTEGSRGTKITKMLSTFGQIAGFSEVMGKVNRAVELINDNEKDIMVASAGSSDSSLVINEQCEHIFGTPHGFYDWIKGSLAMNLENTSYQLLTFQQVFADNETSSNEQTMVEVANKLNYTAGVHKLMDKVIHEGNSVLELRNGAKDNVKEIFSTVQSFISQMGPFQELFGDMGGVSDMLESVGLKGVADFVCLLLGFGTVEGLEQEYREEMCDFSKEEKNAIGMCVSYAQKYASDYKPSTHDDPYSFLNTLGLKDTIDQYNINASDTNKVNLTSFPTSIDLMIESFVKGFETVLPDPSVLMNIPGLEVYVETSSDVNGNQILSITSDSTKSGELKKKLQDTHVIQKLIQHSMGAYSDPAFLAKFSRIEEGKQPKTPSAFIGLLFSSCISPVNADKAREFDVLDHTKLGGMVVGPLLGLGAAAAEKAMKEKQAAGRKALEEDGDAYNQKTSVGEVLYNANQQREALPDPQNRYSPEFAEKVVLIAKELNTNPNWIMQVIEKETGGTFSPSVKNGAGSGATGLIQFMPSTAEGLGTTTNKLATLSAVDQLDYVKKYFEPYTGKLTSLASCYMAVFYPAALGDLQGGNMDKVIFTKLDKDGKETTAYRQNRGMDTGNDGTITIQDITNFVSGGGQKEYFKGKESSETKVQSIDLAEKSIKPSETVLFGASNAGTVAGVIEDTSSRKGVYSFPGESSKVLRQKADDVTERGERTIITSTVNNSYTTEEQAKKAAEDIQAIAQEALDAGSTPVIVLYPNPSNWSDKTVNPNRYEKFQHYNELMKTWCQSQAGAIKPQILDLSVDIHKNTFKRDESGYHVDKNVMKQMFTPYLSQ